MSFIIFYFSGHGAMDGIRPWTFEIRVVHGSDEIYCLLKKSIEVFQVKVITDFQSEQDFYAICNHFAFCLEQGANQRNFTQWDMVH